MRVGIASLLLTCAFVASAYGQITPRTNPADYAGHGEKDGIRVAAEVLSQDQVENMFSTDLSKYVVVEVAVYPRAGTDLNLSPVDFALKLEKAREPIRPASARTIAGILQRRGQNRAKDITLHPNVGLSTGSWGTGTAVGVGVGMGGNAPGPASTDADRRTMEMELDERGLRDVVTSKPIAGYLFFPAAERKNTGDYEFTFESTAGPAVIFALPSRTR